MTSDEQTLDRDVQRLFRDRLRGALLERAVKLRRSVYNHSFGT